MDSAQENVIQNLSRNFEARIALIWGSYFAEQMGSKKIEMNPQKLKEDVPQIQRAFLHYLNANAASFTLSIQASLAQKILTCIEQINNERLFLNEEVGFLVNNDLEEEQRKQRELEQELK